MRCSFCHRRIWLVATAASLRQVVCGEIVRETILHPRCIAAWRQTADALAWGERLERLALAPGAVITRRP